MGARRRWLLAILTIAAILGPLEQARLHTTASLDKHVGLGAWFAAIAAGYAVDRFIAAASLGQLCPGVHLRSLRVALVFPVALGASQSREFSTDWANATGFIAVMRPLVDNSTGRLLVEDPSIAEYYLPAGSQWQRWSSTRNIVLPTGSQHRRPELDGRRGRRRQRGRLRGVHRGGLLLLRRAELRRHDGPGPQHHR